MNIKPWAMALPLTLLALAGCAPSAPTSAAAGPAAGMSASQRAPLAAVLPPGSVPEAVVAQVLPAAQAAADEASKRRKIDYFQVHDGPIGLRIGQGPDAAHVLSFLGTARTRGDLNLELRAFQAGQSVGFHFNYSGPVTLGLAADQPQPPAASGGGYRFELLMGLPGGGVISAYERYLDAFAEHLTRRYQARPFAFDDGPIVFAVHHEGEVIGFLFTNQTARLVLGDRKYADVQQVAFISTEARLEAGYTLLGFNPKTAEPGEAPRYRLSEHERFGTIAEFGEL